ncbi:antirestriction protein ArdA [Brevibacillus migulae]|uniref:antirestriction protein ArdA n=1 Tax=Brevibacillus migulae TaxID=1644114 RepID=UPI00106DF790|nr:antirestriction protein ArdA [Brevibacillus migulae]
MKVKLYVANLAKYNEGKLAGEWLTLPLSNEEIAEQIQAILGDDKEYAIHDYEAPFRINEYDNVYSINETAAVMARYDSRIVIALCECMDNVGEVVRLLENGDYSVYLNVDNLCDVAAEMVDEGYFGSVPPSLSQYIDYEKIARDLKFDGWYMHYELQVAVRPHS